MSQQPIDGPSSILVGIDGSETSMRAAAYAAGNARRQHSKLVCLYVRTIGAMAAVSPGAIAPMRNALDDLGIELRDTVESSGKRLGIDVLFVSREGNPFTELVRLADELHVDAIMVGASSQAGHRLVGSLASHLVRSARWPVTVVP